VMVLAFGSPSNQGSLPRYLEILSSIESRPSATSCRARAADATPVHEVGLLHRGLRLAVRVADRDGEGGAVGVEDACDRAWESARGSKLLKDAPHALASALDCSLRCGLATF
jgi:hypothetical protein